MSHATEVKRLTNLIAAENHIANKEQLAVGSTLKLQSY